MKGTYLIFNINNCARDYASVSEFCESLKTESGKALLPADLKGRVFIFREGDGYTAERLLAESAQMLSRGLLDAYEEETVFPYEEAGICLRIAHETGDATIEYIYLDALLHKFRNLICFLYTDGETDEKYAIVRKAAEFFYGFSVKNKPYRNNIYGEYCDNQDHIWYITRLESIKIIAEHFKVNPVIELAVEENDILFWRNSIRQHRENQQQEDSRIKQVLKRCKFNFIEELGKNSKKRNSYYQEMYDNEEFQKATQEMPLLAFYLFCMQMYYLKDGKLIEKDEIKWIRLNAWDIADGILQLIENIHHTTERIGFLHIRVHENSSRKRYLREHYGISNEKYRFYYEIRLLDISKENIVESFQRNVGNIIDVSKMKVAHFFERNHKDVVERFWSDYNQKEENLVHHYGLQVFSAIISVNDGMFKVVSSSGYQYNKENETYINRDDWGGGGAASAHMPGTEYIMLIPLRKWEQQIMTAVETDMKYQYDMEAQNYEVFEYEMKTVPQLFGLGYHNQDQKEKLINILAEEMLNWMSEKAYIVEERAFVTTISIDKCRQFPLEVYCKAFILCGIWWKTKCDGRFYCILDHCAQNQFLEIARLFAIFYSKVYLPRYLSDMQVYLVGENEELLITGSDLNNLYTITSKIMLVKGINKETTGIMKYLIGQYRVDRPQEDYTEKAKLVPFDMFMLPGMEMTLFEKNVMKTLEADIQKHSLGCRINHTHMRIGSKLHIDTFYEAELLFHNDYYVSRFAYLILRKLPVIEDRKLILVGYETYSELLLYKMVMAILDKGQSENLSHEASYMIYEQRLGGRFRYMDDECLQSDLQLQFAIIIPINSTLTTHNKVRNSLEEELTEKGLLGEGSFQVIANYALILIRSSEGAACDNLEQKFWQNISERRIQTKLIPEGEPDVEYFVCVHTKWYSPLACPICFPQDYTQEKPLVETDRASIVPVQMLGMSEPDLMPRIIREKSEDNLERIKALKSCLIYRHVVHNGKHFLYYFCLERYFIQERSKVIEWLKEEHKKINVVTDRLVYDIIVSPLRDGNAGFLAEVNHYLFDNAALVLNFEVEKEFRENVRTKYSNIIGLYYNLIQMGKKAVIRFHFVDDTITTANTLARAKTIFRSLIYPSNENVRVEVFSDIVVLLNRMSGDSILNLVWDESGHSGWDERMAHFHSYANLNISSMRNHEDACTECKLVQNFVNLRMQSSTNQQYNFWNDKIECHSPIEVQNRIQEELLIVEEERKERAYRRMICTHLANERLGELGYEKNDSEKVRSVMIELMTDHEENQIEWIISYVKVFSRPFLCFMKSNREAIFEVMLLMIEYITGELTVKRGISSRYRDIKKVCSCIRDLKGRSEDIICNLLLILMKRLSDLGSNYIIRKENIINILRVVDKLQISKKDKGDFRERYIGIIKRVCCQSSDESKSIFLEYLLFCGEEYGILDENSETIKLREGKLAFCEFVEEEFVWRAFVENTRVLTDGIRDLARDVRKEQKKKGGRKKKNEVILQEYYYENFKILLYLYGYWNRQEDKPAEDGKELLKSVVRLSQYLEEGTGDGREQDAEVFYEHLLEIIEQLTGAYKCYLLYGTDVDTTGMGQYYRIQVNGNMENLKIADTSLKMENMVADTYVPAFSVEENEMKLKRTIIKYDLFKEQEAVSINRIYLQMDYPEHFSERRILIALKLVMVFHERILRQLRRDFSNNMIQKWSSREYFNKQVLLQRATDHTDRDNLLKYYNEISHLCQRDRDQDERQRERDRALFHMVINSYIARMNVQILAEANPEREPSKASFLSVYRKQLSPLIESMHLIEKFRILDENGVPNFSNSLLDRNVRLRQTQEGESLSYRRISVIIAELILSAINHSGGRTLAEVYIYREGEYLVVKNHFPSKKGLNRIRQDITDSVERKKDGISLATIRGTVNACYGLTEGEGVVIKAELEDRKKYFYVKLPILQIRRD